MIRSLVLACALAGVGAPLVHAAPPMRGVALGMYQQDQGKWEFARPLEEIRALGADHVSLVVSWKQHDVRAMDLGPADGTTIPDRSLRAVIRQAHAQQLKVFLFPIVEVEVRRPLEWRGTIAPNDSRKWWARYEQFILHYARLAGEENVDVFSVGSELVSTESWIDRWIHLIAAVERVYDGALLYSANWDHYEQVSFWHRVDYIGVTAYNELARANDAAEAELAAAWMAVRGRLVEFAKRIEKPLVVTEVGYTSQDGAAVHPWDYTSRAPIDHEEQRRCYAAFVTAWKDEPALAGVFFWNWYGDGGAKDMGYTPKGKPAEMVLKTFFAPLSASAGP